MAKYLLQNLVGETLGEYARKDAALKAAAAAELGDGDFVLLNDKGEQVHPAPAKADKPKAAKKPRAAKIDAKVGDFQVKSAGSYVDVLNAEGDKIFICQKSRLDEALTLERGKDLRKYQEILVDGKAKAWIAKGLNKTQEKAIVAAAKTAIANAST